MPSPVCLSARSSLSSLRSLRRDFNLAYDTAVVSGKPTDIKRAQSLKQELEYKMVALREQLSPLEAERRFDLKRQYVAQTELLKLAGLVEVKNGLLSMKDINGRDCPVPSYDSIIAGLVEQKELLETKRDQGFTKLLIVPFGMSLDEMIGKFKAYLLAKQKVGKTPALSNLNKDPVWNWDGYKDADKTGKLVYDPQSFDASHSGKKKGDIMGNGWRVILLQGARGGQGFRSIPRQGAEQEQGEKLPRTDIIAGKTPREYLAVARTAVTDSASAYHGESGMTPEEWITLFMSHLEETGSLLDDYQNNQDSIAYLTGAYFEASDYVPDACWFAGDRRAYLNGGGPDYSDGYVGPHFAVRVVG